MMARSCPSIEVTAAEGSRLCCRVPRGTGKRGWAECAAEALAGVNVALRPLPEKSGHLHERQQLGLRCGCPLDPKGDRDLGVAYQTHPGNQASSRGEAKNSAVLLSPDGYLLEPTVCPKGSQASCVLRCRPTLYPLSHQETSQKLGFNFY